MTALPMQFEWQQRLQAVQSATEHVLDQETTNERAALDQARIELQAAQRRAALAQQELAQHEQTRVTAANADVYAARLAELRALADAYNKAASDAQSDVDAASQRLVQARQRVHARVSTELEQQLTQLIAQAQTEVKQAMDGVHRLQAEWERKINEARQRRQSFGAVMPLS